MDGMTIEEIIKESKKRGINLGEDPAKTIRFYTRLGFIPKPIRKRSKNGKGKLTKLYYSEFTLDKLAEIKALKSKGLSLDEIRDSFALEYVQKALQDLLSKAGDEKVRQLAHIIGSKENELESIIEAPLMYILEGMSQEEVKKLLTLFVQGLSSGRRPSRVHYGGSKRVFPWPRPFKAIFYN